MEASQAVMALAVWPSGRLAAVAQDDRLGIFRLLVQVGLKGMAAGHIAEKLGLAPNGLTFHSTVSASRACHCVPRRWSS